MHPQVLIVDDDAELSAMLVLLLQDEGWMAQAVRTAATAERAIVQHPPDVVLLDMMLPDGNGPDLCRRWRATQPAVGILMLTTRGDPVDQRLGQALGADDVLPKPFEKRELVNRLRALLRLKAPAATLPTTHWSFGRLTIHLIRREALVDGRAIPLTDTEFKLLVEVARQPGVAVPPEQLNQAVQAGAHLQPARAMAVQTNAQIIVQTDSQLDVQMDRLRRHLASATPGNRWIDAIPGHGYAFVPQTGASAAPQHDAAAAV